jgi:hypothetical protein
MHARPGLGWHDVNYLVANRLHQIILRLQPVVECMLSQAARLKKNLVRPPGAAGE